MSKAPGVSLAIVVALALSTVPAVLSAGKPAPTSTPASVVFANRASDRLVGDGAAYQGGTRGVDCQIYTGGSQDFTLNVFNSSKPKRRYGGTYAAPVGGVGPAGSFTTGWWVRVANVGAMFVNPAGESRVAGFMFDNSTSRRFRFAGTDVNAQLVLVQRMSRTEWVVTADPSALGDDGGNAAGDLAILEEDAGGAGWVALGRYHMPVKLYISCPNCPCAAGDSNCR